jgi:hypothetical protein
LIIIKVLKHVMSSATEAEIGAVFVNAKEGAVLRTILEELGHKRPPTPMETDNTTATGYSNGTIKHKRTKAMDMRFYWIKDRLKRGRFNVHWGPGFQNLADYFTKRHSPAHRKRMRDIYIHASERPINREGIFSSGRRTNTPSPPWEMIHLPLGDNALCAPPYTAVCNKYSQPLINRKYQIQVTKNL